MHNGSDTELQEVSASPAQLRQQIRDAMRKHGEVLAEATHRGEQAQGHLLRNQAPATLVGVRAKLVNTARR